eukprot:scpid30218/ scgid12098/ Uncharacterized WD repeat-containing protein all2124
MAMAKAFVIADAHKRDITAVEFLPYKREYVTACEGGFLSFWEADTGKQVNTIKAHPGAVMALAVWSDAKTLLSGSLDGTVKTWTSVLECRQIIDLQTPVYSMAWHLRTGQLLVGVEGAMQVISEKEGSKLSGRYLKTRADYVLAHHEDIVQGIQSYESRVYSAGMDSKLIAYETYSDHGRELIRAVTRRECAHTCGIPFLTVGKDTTGNIWVITGSYDRYVRIWSMDLQAIYSFGHNEDIRGLCVSHFCNQLWVMQNQSTAAHIYDPKSGEELSDYMVTHEEMLSKDLGILKLFSWSETGDIVGTTRKRSLVVWKFDYGAPMVINKVDEIQHTLAYTRKVPILIFSGGEDGDIVKWEKQQLSSLRFSTETLPYSEAADKVRLTEEEIFAREQARRLESGGADTGEVETEKHISINRVVFVESCDYLIAGCDDSNIYVWGFNEQHRRVQREMEEKERLNPEHSRTMKLMSMSTCSFMSSDAPRSPTIAEEDSSGNRVAGFECLYTLCYHILSVTALAVVPQEGNKYPFLLSSGWDRRLVLWNTQTGRVVDSLRPPAAVRGKAAADIVTDLAYSKELNLFAYSSADKKAYIRKFARDGKKMLLEAELSGHRAEVTKICWNKFTQTWITSSADQTVAIWASHGESRLATLRLDGTVSALTVDTVNGCVLAASESVFWVFNPYTYQRLRRCKGHRDRIRAILHVPENNQYVTCSWDKTMRLWNSHKAPLDRGEEEVVEEEPSPLKSRSTIRNTGEKQRQQQLAHAESNIQVVVEQV